MNDVTEKLADALRFYANPDIYKAHPHGSAFERRDLSYTAREAIAAYEASKGGGVSEDLMRYTESNGMRPHLDGEWVLYEDARAALEAAGCGVDVEAVREVKFDIDQQRKRRMTAGGRAADFDDLEYWSVKLARAIGDSRE